MSRKKHNVAYIRPDEPKFLRELKEQAGYTEGPTIETKRAVQPDDSDTEREESAEEQPVVVVLNSGDLTAEEAEAYQKEKEEEEANAPADLNRRIIFRKSKTADRGDPDASAEKPAKKKVKRAKQGKLVLSFDNNEEEDT